MPSEYLHFTKVLCIEVDGDQDSCKKHLESLKILVVIYQGTGFSNICRKCLEQILSWCYLIHKCYEKHLAGNDKFCKCQIQVIFV